jgi:hypothetical protein
MFFIQMQPLPTLQLTPEQLAAFVQSAGIAITPLSPVHGAAVPAGVVLPEAVASHVDVFMPVAHTLSAPRLALTASAATAESVVFIQVYGSAATGSELIGCTKGQGGIFELVPALDAHSWRLVLFKGLALETAPDAPAAMAPMSRRALLACAAMVDVIKEARLNALLARQSYPEPVASTSAVVVAAKAATLVPDARWFSGLVRRLLPDDPGPLSHEDARQGLNELAKLGWMTTSGADEWEFTEAMQPHAIAWGVAAVSGLFSLHSDEPGGLRRLHVGMIRTLSGLWVIECPPEDEMLKVGTMGGRALLMALTKAVENQIASISVSAGHTGVRTEAAPPAAASLLCASCGAVIPAGARFCAGCGKPVQQTATPMCPKCGKPVHAGEKFCGSCGRRLS